MIDRRATAADPPPLIEDATAIVHRFTCTGCGQAFVCERPTSTDSSWNRYALHSYHCPRKWNVPGPGYVHDEIDSRPFNPIAPQPVWSPYP